MKIIAIANRKGGVGKTLIAENLAYLLSRNSKVLIVDLDENANLTAFFTRDNEANLILGTSSIFCADNELSFMPATIVDEVSESLFISPVNDTFKSSLLQAQTAMRREYLLQNALVGHDFDYVILDCPPNSTSIQQDNALACASEVIVPVKDDINSMTGVQSIVKAVSIANQGQPLIRVVHNLYIKARKSLNRQSEEWLESVLNSVNEYQQSAKPNTNRFKFLIDDMKIPLAAIANDAQCSNYPIEIAAPKSTTALALFELCEKIK